MTWIDVFDGLPEMLPRDRKDGTRLVSAWVDVLLEDGRTEHAYLHFLHGWMKSGEPEGDFIYGFIPLHGVVMWKQSVK